MVPHAPVHGDVHAIGQRLHRADGGADVEHGIGALEAGRVERAGEHDDLAGDAGQHLRGLDHGVGAVGDQHVAGRLRLDRAPHQCAVLAGDVQAVLADDRDDVEAEGGADRLQDLADLRRADLERRLVVEVDLVDRPARGDDAEVIHGAPLAGTGAILACAGAGAQA